MDNYSKEFADELGSYIADFRNANNLSQRMFAEKCQISKTAVANLENHQHSGNILIETLDKISLGLNLKNSDQLRTIINERIKHPELRNVVEADEVIVVMKKNSKIYRLYQDAKNLSDKSLEMLHNIASEFKK